MQCARQLMAMSSYDFSIKWLTPFYPANSSQAAGGGEKCMDLRFLRLRRWLLKQQPNKTVFNRFIENQYQRGEEAAPRNRRPFISGCPAFSAPGA